MALNLIKTKRAIRKFTTTPVSDEDIRKIVNAGRHAPSSMNDQPWRFIVLKNRENLKTVSECSRSAGHLATAAFGIILAYKKGYEFDIGQAAAYMQLTAWELGIGSCIAGLQDITKAKKILNVPDEYTLHYTLSFGYPAEKVGVSLKKGGRKPLDEIMKFEKM